MAEIDTDKESSEESKVVTEKTNKYTMLHNMLTKFRCSVCEGSGRLDTPELRKVAIPEWPCRSCEGSGVTDNLNILFVASVKQPMYKKEK